MTSPSRHSFQILVRTTAVTALTLAVRAAIAAPFPAEFEVASLQAANGGDGSAGTVFLEGGLNTGRAVSGIGDLNGDGFDDFAISAPVENAGGGLVYVLFGTSTGFPAEFSPFDLRNGDGSEGFVLSTSIPGLQLGNSIASAGDVNGDGVNDMVLGGRIRGHLVFGRSLARGEGFPATIDLGVPGELREFGITLNGVGSPGGEPQGVVGIGDINGDGIDDVAFGAITARSEAGDSTGSTFVLFGRDTAGSDEFELRLDLDLLRDGDGSRGFVVNGLQVNERSGIAVGAGDFNGDGLGDLVIGAPYADVDGLRDAGLAYVVFGRDADRPFPAEFPAATVWNGADGFALFGRGVNGLTGLAVAGAGDTNGDGIDDLLIGAPGNRFSDTPGPGEAYLVYGRDQAAGDGFPAVFRLASLLPVLGGDGSQGAYFLGINLQDRAGSSVNGAGDTNGDGYDDFLIGAQGADPGGVDSAGEAYLLYGRDVQNPFPPITPLVRLLPPFGGDGSVGAVFNGIEGLFGSICAAAGDVNGDGLGDLLFGAELAEFFGQGYLIYGRQ